MLNRQSIVAALKEQGILVSHFMQYWTLEELTRYYVKHSLFALPAMPQHT